MCGCMHACCVEVRHGISKMARPQLTMRDVFDAHAWCGVVGVIGDGTWHFECGVGLAC